MRRLVSIWCSVLLTVLAGLGSAAFAHDQEFEGEGVGDGQQYVLAPCIHGAAFIFPCSATDLIAWVPPPVFGDFFASDVWGWTDPETGREYAILGHHDGTAFFDLGDPADPVYLGTLPTQTVGSSWRDIKTYADHAFIVSEAGGHGMQVFDLIQLRSVTAPPVVFAETAHYGDFGSAHNLVINEETGYAYGVGTNTCAGGLHIVDVTKG